MKKSMKVNVIFGAQSAFACIKTPTRTLDVKLEPGRSAAKSLVESATEMREKAAKLIDRATLIETAAPFLGYPQTNGWAFKEGWGIFDADGELQLQRIDDPEDTAVHFASDAEAMHFVVKQATAGSPMHKAVLDRFKRESPAEFQKIQEAGVGVVVQAEQSKAVATKVEFSKTWVNPAQRKCLERYAGGDFEYMLEYDDEAVFKTAMDLCGDTLLRFLVSELATSEDCDSVETAIGRVSRAIDDLQAVHRNLGNLPEDLSWSTEPAEPVAA